MKLNAHDCQHLGRRETTPVSCVSPAKTIIILQQHNFISIFAQNVEKNKEQKYGKQTSGINPKTV